MDGDHGDSGDAAAASQTQNKVKLLVRRGGRARLAEVEMGVRYNTLLQIAEDVSS